MQLNFFLLILLFIQSKIHVYHIYYLEMELIHSNVE